MEGGSALRKPTYTDALHETIRSTTHASPITRGVSSVFRPLPFHSIPLHCLPCPVSHSSFYRRRSTAHSSTGPCASPTGISSLSDGFRRRGHGVTNLSVREPWCRRKSPILLWCNRELTSRSGTARRLASRPRAMADAWTSRRRGGNDVGDVSSSSVVVGHGKQPTRTTSTTWCWTIELGSSGASSTCS